MKYSLSVILVVFCLASSCKKETEEPSQPSSPPPFVPCGSSLTENQVQWGSSSIEVTPSQCSSTYIQALASSGLAIIELGSPIESDVRLDITPSNPGSGEASVLVQTEAGQPSQRAVTGFLYAQLLEDGAIKYSWCDLECVAPPSPNGPDAVIVSGQIICE